MKNLFTAMAGVISLAACQAKRDYDTIFKNPRPL